MAARNIQRIDLGTSPAGEDTGIESRKTQNSFMDPSLCKREMR